MTSVCKIPDCGQPRTTKTALAARYRLCDEHFDDMNRKASLKAYYKLKNRVYDALGRECSHCGFGDPRALQVDHRDGGGRKHRATLRGSTSRAFYQAVLANPEGFQILCANCNWIKRHTNEEL